MPTLKSERCLSILNFTENSIEVSLGVPNAAQSLTLGTQENQTISYVHRGSSIELILSRSGKLEEGAELQCKVRLKKRITGWRRWEEIDCARKAWRVYRHKISKRHHQVLIFPCRPLSSWMKELPDSVLLSDLCLPGTHETMALYGWPFSQCQDVTLKEQFHQGVRMLDIRVVLFNGVLTAFHGATPERATFTSILKDVCSFLQSPEGQSETVIMSIKEEASFIPSSPLFSSLVRDAIFGPPSHHSMWYLENRIPTLGEVRGKIVMFSRFGRESDWEGGFNGIGIHPSRWPNSRREGFEWELEKTRVRTQDWYDIPSFLSIPEKFAVSVQMLLPRPAPEGKSDLAITFLSAARVPVALPSTVACGFGWRFLNLGVEGVNSRTGRWLLQQLSGSADGINTIGAAHPFRRIKDTSQLTLVGSRQTIGEKNSDERVKPTSGRTQIAQTDVRLRGWVMMDFIMNPDDTGIIPLLVECNWRGRVPGEEGWSL